MKSIKSNQRSGNYKLIKRNKKKQSNEYRHSETYLLEKQIHQW